jgi:RNA polymerase sigma factor (sigma-70 family)
MATVLRDSLLRHLYRLVPSREVAALTDAQLLQRFLAGRETAAFETLLRRHGPMVWAVCRQVLHDPHEAEDAFQATFLVLLHKAGTLAQPERLGNWLYGTAYFTARNARVSASRRRARERLVRALAPSCTILEVEMDDDKQILLEELSRLPEKYRVPVVLCELQGRGRREVARQLGWAEGTVSSRLARARVLLRQRLARRGVTLVAGPVALALTSPGVEASVPVALAAATVKTARLLAAGQAGAAAAGAAPAIALMQGVLHARSATRLTAVAWLLMLAVLAGGVSLAAQHVFTDQSPQTKVEGLAQPAARRLDVPASDLYGDPLPPGALARLGSIRLRPGTEVTALAFSADGRVLASVPIYTNRVQLWDVATGKPLRQFTGHSAPVIQLAFSPGGRRLVSGSLDHTVRVWDVGAGVDLQRITVPLPGNFALSPDGRTLAVSNEDKTVHLWDLAQGKDILSLKTGLEATIRKGFEPEALAFSADGKELATAEDGTLRVWEVATGRLRGTFAAGRFGSVTAATFTPEGVIAVSGYVNGPNSLWKAAKGKPPVLITLVRQAPQTRGCVAISPDGKTVLLGTTLHEPRLYDAATGKMLHGLTGLPGNARSAAFSADGKTLAVGVTGGTLHLWDTATGKERSPVGEHNRWLEAVAFSHDGQTLVTASADGVLRVWEPATGRALGQLPVRAPAFPAGVAYSPDGQRLAVGGLSKGIWVGAAGLDPARGRIFGEEPAFAVAFSYDSQTLISATAGVTTPTVRWWDVATGRERTRYPPASPQNWMQAYLAAAERSHPPCFAVASDGRTAALGGRDFLLCVRETERGKVRRLFERKQGPVVGLAFSPDDKTLVSVGEDHRIDLWEVSTGEPRARLERTGKGSGILDFSPDTLALSPDGNQLAVGASDGIVRLWDIANATEMGQFKGHQGAIRQLVFSADGRRLASAGGTDTTALVWMVPPVSRRGPQRVPLSSTRLQKAWDDLAGKDASRAYEAILALAAAPQQSVPFLRERLPSRPPVDDRQIALWVADLDSDRFATRTRASTALQELGLRAEPFLRKALASLPSLDQRQRIEQLLAKLERGELAPEQLRQLRALEVFERSGTPEARRALAGLAEGSPDDPVVSEARRALQRLSLRLTSAR